MVTLNDVLPHTEEGFVAFYTVVRGINIALCVLLLLEVVHRTPLWRSRPPAFMRLIGLGASLATITILTGAIDHTVRGVDPGVAQFGALSVLISLGFAVALMPEADGRPAPIMRGLERLGVRARSRHSRR